MSDKRKVIINVDDFTVGDFIDFEDVAGRPLTDAMRDAAAKTGPDGEEIPGSVPMKVMLALLWLANKADGVTLDEVRTWKITELDIEFVGGEENEAADPQSAGASA